MKLFAFTIDLEADYAGFVDKYEIFKDLDKVEKLLSSLDDLGVKITAFTVGKVFETFPDVIKLFEKYNSEFEVHSYSHDFKNPDSELEIIKGKKAYMDYFKKEPLGYRAPRGMISPAGIKNLEKHGFLYDTSIFPSYFPNPFRYLFYDNQVHYCNDSKLLEIPISTVSPLRILLSISYIKLFGVDFFINMSRRFSLPDIICFDTHLHDYITNDISYNGLSRFWQMIYSRNMNDGLDYCIKYLKYVQSQGYRFCHMSEIYDLYIKDGRR